MPFPKYSIKGKWKRRNVITTVFPCFLLSNYKKGRRQKNFQGRGQRKKQDRKVAQLSLFLLHQYHICMEGREPWPPWIFIHGTNKVKGGLMVLFFGLVFPLLPPPPREVFLPTPLQV